MRVFFGAAIQGHVQRGERSAVYRQIISSIKGCGGTVVSEHTTGESFAETAARLQESLGELPPVGRERTIFVRDKMIELIESDLAAAIFEVSTPSLGTGIEIAHAYLRPRMGLKEIPILTLYQKKYWGNGLSTMIAGITGDVVPKLRTAEFESVDEIEGIVRSFLGGNI